MSTVIVRRQERHEAPEMPHGEIVLQPPPEIPEVAADGLQQMMTYLPMLAMTFGMVAMMSGSGSGSLRWVGGGAMGLGMGGMALGQMARGKGDRKLRLNGQRRDYLRYLGQIRRQVRRAASAQRQALEWTSPPPAALWWVTAANQHARVWERRPQDADFGTIRLGTGTQQLGVRLVPPQTKPAEDLDPLCAGALRRFIRTHARVPELPVGMSLRAFSRVCVAGDPGAARGMVRAMTAQLAAFHSPEEVRICVCAPADRMREWDWAKWLPHTLHATERDAAGPVRLMAETLPQLEAMLGADIKDRPRFSPGRDTQGGGSLPYYVVIVDGAAVHPGDQLGGDGVDGVTLVQVTGGQAGPADAATLRLQVAGGRLDMITRDRAGADIMARIGAPDTLSRAEAEALARELAPLRPARGGAPGEDALAVNTTLTALLGIAEARALDLPGLWRSRPARSRLRVPIGLDASGQPVELDIKESAQGGMGPARPGHRRDRVRQVRTAPHPGARARADSSPRGAELRAGRLQGRRDLPRPGGPQPRVGRHHQPGGRTAAGRPDAGRAARGDGPPPGAAPVRGQLRVGPRLRARPGTRDRPRRRCRPCSSWSTSSPNCWRPSRSSSTCS